MIYAFILFHILFVYFVDCTEEGGRCATETFAKLKLKWSNCRCVGNEMERHCPQGTYRYYIRAQYGVDVLNRLNSLLSLNQKLAEHRCHVSFLRRCLHNDILPRGFCIKNIWTRDNRNVCYLRSVGFRLMRFELSHHYRSIHNVCRKLRLLWSDLNNILAINDNQRFNGLAQCKYRSTALKANLRHNRKFSDLCSKQHPSLWPNNNFRDSVLINNTNIEFTNPEKDVLALDPKFVCATKKPPVSDLIVAVESINQKLPSQTVQDKLVRTTVNCIKHYREHNLNREHVSAIRSIKVKLRQNDALLMRADKGNKTVIVNKSDYENKIKSHLDNPAIYEDVPNSRNPVLFTRTKLNRLLAPIKTSKPTFRMTDLLPSVDRSKLPEPYALAKVHKPEMPFRIIAPTYSFVSYRLSKLIHKMLYPFVTRIPARISSARDFLQDIHSLNLPDNFVICSFDVVSLFDNVDVNAFLSLFRNLVSQRNIWVPFVPIFESLPDSSIVEIASVILNNSYLKFLGSVKRQRFGVPMGSPCSVAVSELFMDYIETKALSTCPTSCKPIFYRRFIDDGFSIFKGDTNTINNFLTHLNSINPRVQFTVEYEKNGQLPFLDILLTRKSGCISFSVYQKPTHSNRYAHPSSFVPRTIMASVTRALRLRAYLYCDDRLTLDRELNRISSTLKDNGYPKETIRNHLRHPRLTTRNRPAESPNVFIPFFGKGTFKVKRLCENQGLTVRLSHLPTLHDKLYYKRNENLNIIDRQNVVYRLTCRTCQKSYIGQTTRPLKKRIDEHIKDAQSTKDDNKITGVSLHIRSTGHRDFDPEILDRDNREWGLKIRESIKINEKSPCLNGNDGGLEINRFWNEIFR